MSLAVIIVNYRSAPLTVDCLNSAVEQVRAVPGGKIWVVDNASQDDSLDQIGGVVRTQSWEDCVTLMPMSENQGFGAGNNAVFRRLLNSPDAPEYFLLLNPDTLVKPGAIRKMVDFMDRMPATGIAGCRLETAEGTPQTSTFRFHTALGEFLLGLNFGVASRMLKKWNPVLPIVDSPCAVDWVAGACMIIRRGVLESAGIFDEGYFLYFEEVDLCFRAAKKGWSCWYFPGSRVVHLVGQSTGFQYGRENQARFPSHWFDSRRRFLIKAHGRLYAVLADFLWVLGFSMRQAKDLIRRKKEPVAASFFLDFVANSACFKGVSHEN